MKRFARRCKLMKKKTLASTVLSIIIVSVVILAAGIRCALQPESKDFMQFKSPVIVTDSGVEYELEPIHFEPIGKKVTFVGAATISGKEVTITPVSLTVE